MPSKSRSPFSNRFWLQVLPRSYSLPACPLMVTVLVPFGRQNPSESLCNVGTGTGCKAPPTGGAGFYPFWTLTSKQKLKGVSGRGVCLWNFGNVIAGVTTHNFGRDAEYGTPDIARYGGTIVSKVLSNPALGKDCKAFA